MSSAVITNVAKNKILKARAGDDTLPTVKGFVFGNGGLDASGTPIEPDPDQTELGNQLYEKNVASHSFPTSTSCVYECTLQDSECPLATINEIGLIDSDDDLIAIKTFLNKSKASDLELTFRMTDAF